MRNIFLLTISLFFCSCVQYSYPREDSIKKVVYKGDFQILTEEPFNMPKDFPLPEDSYQVNKPLKGRNLNFKTKLNIPEIVSFYSSRMTNLGLTEATHLTNSQDKSMSITFYGWPDEKSLTIQALDLAYSSSSDERSVSARVE